MEFCLRSVGKFGEKSIRNEIVNVALDTLSVVRLKFCKHSGDRGTKETGRVLLLLMDWLNPLAFRGRVVVGDIDRFDRGLDGQSANLPVTTVVVVLLLLFTSELLLLPPRHGGPSGHQFFFDGNHGPAVTIGQVMPVVGDAAEKIDTQHNKKTNKQRNVEVLRRREKKTRFSLDND